MTKDLLTVQPPYAENRTYDGVGGVTGANPVTSDPIDPSAFPQQCQDAHQATSILGGTLTPWTVLRYGSGVPARISQFILAITLALLIGGHWAILQSVAWVGMTLTEFQKLPLRQALIKTFDGKHLCQLCKFVQTGKKSDRKKDFESLAPKFEFVHELNSHARLPMEKYSVPVAGPMFAVSRLESPPVPPPRPSA